MGKVKNILNIESLKEKWQSFNWQVQEIDGHNFQEIERALLSLPGTEKPIIIIARTIKGKGVSFMENNILWHYKDPQNDLFNKAKQELSISNEK